MDVTDHDHVEVEAFRTWISRHGPPGNARLGIPPVTPRTPVDAAYASGHLPAIHYLEATTPT